MQSDYSSATGCFWSFRGKLLHDSMDTFRAIGEWLPRQVIRDGMRFIVLTWFRMIYHNFDMLLTGIYSPIPFSFSNHISKKMIGIENNVIGFLWNLELRSSNLRIPLANQSFNTLKNELIL